MLKTSILHFKVRKMCFCITYFANFFHDSKDIGFCKRLGCSKLSSNYVYCALNRLAVLCY